MHCKKCGAEISDHASFCPKCGEKIKKETGKPERRKRSAVVAAVGIFAAAAVLALLWFFQFREGEGSAREKDVTTEASATPEVSSAPEDNGPERETEESAAESDTQAATGEMIETTAAVVAAAEEEIDLLSYYNADTYTPYYGIWIAATKDRLKAWDIDPALKEQGYDDTSFMVAETTDWSNLNSEPWYVTAVGPFQTEEAAKEELSRVQTVYPSAYVKYSGDYIGHNDMITYRVSSEDQILETDSGYAIQTPLWGEYDKDIYLQIDEQTKIVADNLEECQEGDNGLTWYKRNLERSRTTGSYEANMAMMGIFTARVTGYHVDEICGCYWWD